MQDYIYIAGKVFHTVGGTDFGKITPTLYSGPKNGRNMADLKCKMSFSKSEARPDGESAKRMPLIQEFSERTPMIGIKTDTAHVV